MANIFVTHEVCGTCNGEKTIVCCSCTADDECQTYVCPTCHGQGHSTHYNMPAIVGAVCVAVAVVAALVFLF